MARSTYIYVVFIEDKLFSAFTVKHEMIRIIEKYPAHMRKIYRVRDGTDYVPVEMKDL